jgi:hypothetical protein
MAACVASTTNTVRRTVYTRFSALLAPCWVSQLWPLTPHRHVPEGAHGRRSRGHAVGREREWEGSTYGGGGLRWPSIGGGAHGVGAGQPPGTHTDHARRRDSRHRRGTLRRGPPTLCTPCAVQRRRGHPCCVRHVRCGRQKRVTGSHIDVEVLRQRAQESVPVFTRLTQAEVVVQRVRWRSENTSCMSGSTQRLLTVGVVPGTHCH